MTAEGGTPAERRTQLLRGVLDICLLAVIAERARYGYELVEALAAGGMPLVSEGSIYPLLARLERAGLVSSYRERSGSGPPRKYYRLTAAGSTELNAGRQGWEAFATAVDRVLAARPSTTAPVAKSVDHALGRTS